MAIKEILQKNSFRFNKHFGQNFITDTNLLTSIVDKAGVEEGDAVLEIGVGAGTLTRALAEKADKVYGYEIDENLRPVLKESLSGLKNVQIIFKDVMKVSTSEIESKIGGKYKLVANLPYYITTPVIIKFIEEAENLQSITVMVQSEVAERICAKENTPEYGSITAGIDVIGDAKIVAKVPRTMFYPVPNVDSAVVRIDINKQKYVLTSRKAYRDVLRVAFSSRRKTLVNNLTRDFSLQREVAETALLSCGIDIKARGESLSTQKFVALTEYLVKNEIIPK